MARRWVDEAGSKTAEQLADAKDTLNLAVNAFEKSKVVALTGLENVTIASTATDSSNRITLENGETLVLTSSDITNAVATVTEDPNGTVKVTGVGAGGPITIVVQVKKDGQIIKSGTFTVNVTSTPTSITSKSITNLDFSTVQATQAKLVSKPVTLGDFTGNRKDFTIVVGGERIPISIYWPLSTDFSKGAAMGSVVDSHIQDYFYQKYGNNGFSIRTVGAFGFDDTFQINTFQTGSASSFTLEGKDWSYFFEQSSAQGTDIDTSKNRTFTISDGTATATIQLTSKFETIDALINHINNRLTNAGVKANVEKVGTSQFKISPTATGSIVLGGANKNDFFN
ncbi:hypothetical protein CD798_15970 [Bacillaceae bacterium SAOS 7]|nr:hypothetical protein CD798_15970 [Bacillaceae bacterium SAOS 7]